MSTIEEARAQAREALEQQTRAVLEGYGMSAIAVNLRDALQALLDATEPPVASEPSGYRAILIQKARAHAVEYRCYDDTDELVGTLVESANMLAADAPVQASTIVDEEALAGEISRHKLVHVSVSRKSAFCMCSSSVRSGTDDNLAWFDKHRAHALAGWLKEQGR